MNHYNQAEDEFLKCLELVQNNYRFSREPKLFISMIEHSLKSINFTLKTIVHYEKKLMLLSSILLEEKLFEKTIKRNHLNENILSYRKEMNLILENYKKSAMVFRKGTNLVILNDNVPTIVTFKIVLNYLKINKELLEFLGKKYKQELSFK
jgi:hypothetical protein